MEATDIEDAIFKLSLGSQDESSQTLQLTTKAKGKRKAKKILRPGHMPNHTHSANVEANENILEGRDNPPKKQGSSTKLNVRSQLGIRRVRSRGNLRRIPSAKASGLLRDGQAVTKKRHEKEQSAGTRPSSSKGPIDDP